MQAVPTDERLPKHDRLKLVFRLLWAGPVSTNSSEAIAAVQEALRIVEDEWTTVVDDIGGNFGEGQRMYLPPLNIGEAWETIPNGKRAHLNSHFADFHNDGRILIQTKQGLHLFNREGASGASP
ncbi:MAG: hypothetical protein WAW69_10005 [Polaromonas sp.]